MLAHGNQAGRQGHHRLTAKIFPGGAIVQRRHAIQDNARTHPVIMRLRPQQDTARGGDRAQSRLAFGKGGEDIQLAFGCAAGRLIGAGEVAHHVNRLADVFALAQTLIKRLGFLRTHP